MDSDRWNIALLAILIFGPRQLPKLGRSLGESVKAMRDVGKELTTDEREHEDD